MAVAFPRHLAQLIEWKFTVVKGREVSRYGEYAGKFWKQYLPAGLEVPNSHPPKVISPEVYTFAQRYASE